MRFRLPRLGRILVALLAVATLGIGLRAYAATLNTTINASITAAYTSTPALGGGIVNLQGNAVAPPISLATGTGTNQADLIYVGRRTLAASASETLDLTGSGASLIDPFGTTLSFLHIKAILVRAASTNTNNVVVGAAASDPFVGPMAGTAPTTAATPGGVILWVNPATGWAVTDSTNDQLKITNSAGTTSVTYDLYIVGTDS